MWFSGTLIASHLHCGYRFQMLLCSSFCNPSTTYCHYSKYPDTCSVPIIFIFRRQSAILHWFPPNENEIQGHLFSRQNVIPTFIPPNCLHGPDFSLLPRCAWTVSPISFCLSSHPNLLTLCLLCETSVKCCVLKHKGSHPPDLLLGNDDPLLWNPCMLPLS